MSQLLKTGQQSSGFIVPTPKRGYYEYNYADSTKKKKKKLQAIMLTQPKNNNNHWVGKGRHDYMLTHLRNFKVDAPHGEVVGSVHTDQMGVITKVVRTTNSKKNITTSILCPVFILFYYYGRIENINLVQETFLH